MLAIASVKERSDDIECADLRTQLSELEKEDSDEKHEKDRTQVDERK